MVSEMLDVPSHPVSMFLGTIAASYQADNLRKEGMRQARMVERPPWVVT